MVKTVNGQREHPCRAAAVFLLTRGPYFVQ